MAITATTKNALSAAVAYTPTVGTVGIAISEVEADCKTKFHAINAGGAALAVDATALSATITPLNANVATTNAERIVVETSNLTATDTYTAGIPAGYVVTDIIIKTTTATTGNAAIALDIGTAGAGTQVVNGASVTGTINTITRCTIVAHVVLATAQDLVFTSADWKAGVFKAWVSLKKVTY
jgi:hypothetical protein